MKRPQDRIEPVSRSGVRGGGVIETTKGRPNVGILEEGGKGRQEVWQMRDEEQSQGGSSLKKDIVSHGIEKCGGCLGGGGGSETSLATDLRERELVRKRK